MATQKPFILAIDDTPANLMTLGIALEREFELQIATTGAIGLALAAQTPPDLILLDIMMPEMNGFEVCRQLKADPVLQDIPVVFVSVLTEIESECRGLALGAVDYITKPVNVEIDRQRIHNLIERETLRKSVVTHRDQLTARLAELEQAKLAVQEQLRFGDVINKIAQTLIESAGPDTILQTTAALVGQALGVDQAVVYQVSLASERVCGLCEWFNPLHPELQSGLNIYPLAAFMGCATEMLRTKQSLSSHRNNVNPHMLADGSAHLLHQQMRIQSLIWYPFDFHDQGFSVLALNAVDARKDWTGPEMDFLGTICRHLSIGLTKTKLCKAHNAQLEHLAHFDALTDLPNRALLADRLRRGMVQEQRRGKKLVVVFLDLDGFKEVNDSHGYETGDQLLITLASRMKQALRDGDTLARIGGDEFVAVLGDLDDAAASIPMLQRLLNAVAQPLMVGSVPVQLSASLGVTCYPQGHEVEADQLLRQADQAMYQAKLAGKNCYGFFDATQDNHIRSHHESLERLRHGLAANEFVLFYQPKVNMHTGAVIGAEALIRWQHPSNGLLLPGRFLPTIENHPLAIELGEWVIHTALSQVELWQDQGLDVAVSVNVGARQLQQTDFITRLQSILARHPKVKPSRLEIEILETSALEDLERVAQVIEDCRALGVMFAMDDFGTGYSSLTYLRRLHVDLLKIDQSFVRDMLNNTDDLAILQGVISLARSFRREVIAEGVETVDQGTLLLQLGCELAQGYGIARPMPAHELPHWVTSWQPDPAWRLGIQTGPPADLPL